MLFGLGGVSALFKGRFRLVIYRAIIFGCLLLSLWSCSSYRKWTIQRQIQDCQGRMTGFSLDTLIVDPELFPSGQGSFQLLPNPQVIEVVKNLLQGKITQPLGIIHGTVTTEFVCPQLSPEDSIQLIQVEGVLSVDSLPDIDFSLAQPQWLHNKTQIPIKTQISLQPQILHYLNSDSATIRVRATFREKETSPPLQQAWQGRRAIPWTEIQKASDNYREKLTQYLLGKWVDGLK